MNELPPQSASGLDDGRSPRVAFFSHSLNLEGAPNSLFELIDGFVAKREVDPVVFAPVGCRRTLKKSYKAIGVPVTMYRNAVPRAGTKRIYEGTLRRFVEAHDLSGFDVLYGNTILSFWVADLARMLGKPFVWNIRESDPTTGFLAGLDPEIRRRAMECFGAASEVIFVSERTREHYEQLGIGGNFRTIHNGLNLARLRGRGESMGREKFRRRHRLGEDDIVLLCLGNVSNRKGQLDLVRAFPFLDPDVARRLHVFIVGAQFSRYSWDLCTAIWSLPNEMRRNIHVVLESAKVLPYLENADLFACTSRVESYPRVTLEAMAFGLPIISTPVFGLAEQVQEGRNGCFYSPGNAEELAERITRLARDPELRERYSAGAKEVLAGLTSYDEMVGAYAEVFRRVSLTKGN